jgi:enoyl-CoA hydratase
MAARSGLPSSSVACYHPFMNGPLTLSSHDGVARITLDDGKANAINERFLTALDRSLTEVEGASAVVLAGRAGFFSGGLDLKTLPMLELEPLQATLEQFARVMLRLFTFKRPVVAASTGHAIAGGTVLLLGCDERFGAEGPFKVGLNETAIGLSLPSFVVEMARCQLPAASLHRIVTCGELFAPSDAKAVGLYDHVVSPESVVELAHARAQLLGVLPDRAYADNKLVLRRAAARVGDQTWGEEIRGFMDFMRRMRGG